MSSDPDAPRRPGASAESRGGAPEAPPHIAKGKRAGRPAQDHLNKDRFHRGVAPGAPQRAGPPAMEPSARLPDAPEAALAAVSLACRSTLMRPQLFLVDNVA